MTAPVGLVDAFWTYERALMANDLATLDELFAPGESTLRGDHAGLLVGHDSISEFRRCRGSAPNRRIAQLQVRTIDDNHALIVAVTEAARGGHGLQTQLWVRQATGWVITAAHVSVPPTTFDSSVWRVVGDPLVSAAKVGPLAGESVAVKDLFAVAGFAIGAGVPAFEASQLPQREHATAVQRLLHAGAQLRGIARTDQFAYSLDGDNPHYGTPVNAVVPGALPGGSSSGSATAVALGAATIGLATDTAGSIRVPASYQRLWGLRATHGSVAVTGLLPLAPDFDAIGLLTRTPDVLARATAALLEGSEQVAPSGILQWQEVQPKLTALDVWVEAFRIHQGFQAWQSHGAWLTAHPGSVAGSAADRFATASAISQQQDDAARPILALARSQLEDILGDQVLVMPTTSGPPPSLWASAQERETHRRATIRLTCLAAICGRPVVSAPVGMAPLVVRSFLGPRSSDRALIEIAQRHSTQ